MRKVGNMTLYTFEEVLDKHYGPIGTPKRDAFEAMVEAGLEEEAKKEKEKQACKADEAARKTRRAQRPTPERLDLAQAKFA
ncbi:MAG: hypothetical protein K2O53_02000 [Bacteroidales bacterium]|nr:hypothetical protein [Bacteroidales bacterium]